MLHFERLAASAEGLGIDSDEKMITERSAGSLCRQ